MLKKILLGILVIVVILLAIFALRQYFPSIFDDIMLWALGFIGFIVAGFKKIFKNNNSNSISSMQKDNNAIKEQMNSLNQTYETNQSLLNKERELHAREIKLLEEQIKLKEMALQSTLDRIQKLKNADPREVGQNLSEAEIEAIMGKPIN
jgi:cell shape-determining protein MreC